MLTSQDIRLIKNLLAVKTDEDIAQILGKPTEEVSRKINQMTGFVHAKKRRIKLESIAEANEQYAQERAAIKQERQVKKDKVYQEYLEAKKQKELALDCKRIEKEQKKLERQEAALKSKMNKKKEKAVTLATFSSGHKGVKKTEKRFKNKVVDYSQMKLVRVDSKTSIYIPIGSDSETEKSKYLSNRK